MTIVAWVLLMSFALLLLVGLGMSFYMTMRKPLTNDLHNPGEYGLEYEEISLRTSDGLQLYGWFIPAAGSQRAVIILHGHGGSMDWDVGRAVYLHEEGFNVLLFDFRAHGRSEGHVASFGYLERRDVLAAVEFLKSRDILRIGVLGFSYGGMAAMLSAPIFPDIRAVISDGGPASKLTAFTARGVELHAPRRASHMLAWLAIAMASLRLRANLFLYDPVRWVSRIAPRPVLFIHGDQDPYLPDFNDLYAAAGEPKEVWRVADAGHTTLSQQMPQEHQRRVVEFMQKNL
jgi:uncharacterized protein